jgi:Type II CAAX prenyl endopeptidase Rce1-like
LLALVLNAILGGILFATHQTWLLPSQANTSAIFELAGGNPEAANDLKLEGLGAKPNDQPETDLQAVPGSKEVVKDPKKATDDSSEPIKNSSGQSPLLDFLASSPWLALLGIAVFFPLGEELVFRGVPMFALWLSARKLSSLERANLPFAWVLGIVAAVVFSLAHGIGSTGFHLPCHNLGLVFGCGGLPRGAVWDSAFWRTARTISCLDCWRFLPRICSSLDVIKRNLTPGLLCDHDFTCATWVCNSRPNLSL